MFGFSELKQTKVYQEAKEEGKQEDKKEGKIEGKIEGKLTAVPLMLNLGATVEQIAESLDLDIDLVRAIAAKVNTDK